MSRLAYQISIFCSFILLMGCATAQRKAKLEEISEQYARALQASDGDVLLSMVSPESQQKFSMQTPRLSELQFSHVEVKKIFPDEKLNSAVVLMSIEYFRNSDPSLMSMVREFRWVYDERYKAWMMADTSPFGSK